jgi:hypothetical protein
MSSFVAFTDSDGSSVGIIGRRGGGGMLVGQLRMDNGRFSSWLSSKCKHFRFVCYQMPFYNTSNILYSPKIFKPPSPSGLWQCAPLHLELQLLHSANVLLPELAPLVHSLRQSAVHSLLALALAGGGEQQQRIVAGEEAELRATNLASEQFFGTTNGGDNEGKVRMEMETLMEKEEREDDIGTGRSPSKSAGESHFKI